MLSKKELTIEVEKALKTGDFTSRNRSRDKENFYSSTLNNKGWSKQD